MGFLDHSGGSLRKRLIYSVIAMLVGFGLCWSYAKKIYGVVQQPIIDALKHNGMPAQLVVTNPVDGFNLYLKTAFVAGLFAASPFILYQIWLFISPGLYRGRETLRRPFHVFDHRPVSGRRILRLQDCFSGRLWIFSSITANSSSR